MKSKLDFIVIGAQKSGTTTLFELLKQHPNIYLPVEKEAPFFGRADREEKGWDWYLKEFFHAADEQQLWGSITPQYMSFPNVAEKIHAMNPNVKLIAILRNPYERAYSHFIMSKRRNYDTREYLEAIQELIKEDKLEESRSYSTETNSYIVRGEYGRILSNYKRVFGTKNLLILFMSDLEKDAYKTLNSICDFLQVSKFQPQGLGNKFHVGGSAQKNKLLTLMMSRIKSHDLYKSYLRKMIPFKFRRRLWLKIDQWNIKKEPEEAVSIIQHIDESMVLLKPIYNKDAQLFEREFLKSFPWYKR